MNTARTADIADRAMARVRYDGGCWEWTGPRDAEGYGRIRRRRSEGLGTRLVHRVVYEALVGPIAPRLEIDHLCRNRACCNPLHLEAVTGAENTRRSTVGLWRRAKTHCPHGHEYTPANIIIKQPHNRRGCRECDRRRVRAYMQARKAAA